MGWGLPQACLLCGSSLVHEGFQGRDRVCEEVQGRDEAQAALGSGVSEALSSGERKRHDQDPDLLRFGSLHREL